MAYTVDFTDGTKSAITVVNSAVDTTTNVGLVGQGYKNYGEVQAENLLHLLENFASGSAPSKPVEGQLWYDSASNQLKYFDDTVANSGNWKPVASMSVQSNAPTAVGETDGHFWLDSDTGILYLYYNGSWITINDVAGDTRVVIRTRFDTDDISHRTVEVIVNGEIVSITTSDVTAWQPQNSGPNTAYLENGVTLLNTQFTTLTRGVNLNQSAGYFFSGTATTALYADLAERYHADAVYPYGTVVKIGGVHEITITDCEFCPDVFGVISGNPAFAMNSGAGVDNTHPYVALAGRIPVRVIGRVNKGDRLVTSSVPGHAMACEIGHAWQYVIGRALEDKVNDEAGLIEVVVGTK
jgi:hypothetical protein